MPLNNGKLVKLEHETFQGILILQFELAAQMLLNVQYCYGRIYYPRFLLQRYALSTWWLTVNSTLATKSVISCVSYTSLTLNASATVRVHHTTTLG